MSAIIINIDIIILFTFPNHGAYECTYRLHAIYLRNVLQTAISDAYEFLFASAADNGSVWIYDYRGRDEQGVELIPEDEIYPDTVGRIKHRLGGRQIQSASKRLATDVKFGTGVSKSTLIASHSSCQQKNNGAGTVGLLGIALLVFAILVLVHSFAIITYIFRMEFLTIVLDYMV